MTIKKLVIRNIIRGIPRNPKQPIIPRRRHPPSWIVLHCDDAANWHVSDLIRYDLQPNHISQKGCPTPTYAYYIERDGTVYQIADEMAVTWHAGVPKPWSMICPAWNEIGLGVCFAHKPHGSGLTPAQWNAGIALVAWIANRYGIDTQRVRGHRELRGAGYDPFRPQKLRKTCPGLDVNLDEYRTETHELKLAVMQHQADIQVRIVCR